MDPVTIESFVRTFGFPVAMVIILLFFHWMFLKRVLNHISHLDLELKNHTHLLQTINASLDTLAKRK